jgi:HEPN domain-containing protein
VNRPTLKQLAEQRVKDADALLSAGCWAAAYYLVGYALECALKACILKYVEETGVIFRDKKFLEGCWTHDPELLLRTAGLVKEFGKARQADPQLDLNWSAATAWNEESRYNALTDEKDARALFQAITDGPHGVLQWVRQFW